MHIVDKTLIISAKEYYNDNSTRKALKLIKENRINRIIYKFELKKEGYINYTLVNIFHAKYNTHYTSHIDIPIDTTIATDCEKQAITWFKIHGLYSQIVK